MELPAQAEPPAGAPPASPYINAMVDAWNRFSSLPQDDELTEVQRTARLVAAMRALDANEHALAGALFDDPLAQPLAGSNALARASVLLESPVAHSGPPGQQGHNGIATRAFVLDKAIIKAVQDLQSTGAAQIQVVNIGAGMDTRPWRLGGLGPGVAWRELDMEDTVRLKTRLLKEAGAQLPEVAGEHEAAQYTYPLRCGSLALLPCTLSASAEGAGLKQILLADGFDPALPTIWVAEGLVMYVDAATLSSMLKGMAELSPPGSVAIITTLSKEAMAMLQEAMDAARAMGQSPLSQIQFYNSLEELMPGGVTNPASQGLLQELGWTLREAAPDLKAVLPRLAPGHYCCSYGFLVPQTMLVEGMVVAARI